MNEKLPLVSVVDARTLPEGLINTTTTFGMPTLLASTTRPVIFTIARRRDAAARAESSVDAVVGGSVGVVVGFAGAADSVDGVGEGAGSGEGEAALVEDVFVEAFSTLGVSDGDGEGVGDFSGFGEAALGSGFVPELLEGGTAAVGSGLGELVDAVTCVGAPICSSRPCSEPLTRR